MAKAKEKVLDANTVSTTNTAKFSVWGLGTRKPGTSSAKSLTEIQEEEKRRDMVNWPVSQTKKKDTTEMSVSIRNILGVGVTTNTSRRSQPNQAPKVQSSWGSAVSSTRPVMNLRSIQAEEAQKTEDRKKRSTSSSTYSNQMQRGIGPWAKAAGAQRAPAQIGHPSSAKSFGNNHSTKIPSGPSLSQIQAQQAHEQQARQSNSQHSARPSASGSWTVAASGTKPKPDRIVAENSGLGAKNETGDSGSNDFFWSMENENKKRHSSPKQPTPSIKGGASDSRGGEWERKVRGKGRPKSEFGGRKMSPAMASWCKSQLIQIVGNEDMTLVDYVYSLSDPADIREYLRNFMGSTPKVSAFATEFINRKVGKAPRNKKWP
jgi:hypothetical protein